MDSLIRAQDPTQTSVGGRFRFPRLHLKLKLWPPLRELAGARGADGEPPSARTGGCSSGEARPWSVARKLLPVAPVGLFTSEECPGPSLAGVGTTSSSSGTPPTRR